MKLSKVEKGSLGSFISETTCPENELTTEGVTVTVYRDANTGEQFVVIDGSGDDVILLTN